MRRKLSLKFFNKSEQKKLFSNVHPPLKLRNSQIRDPIHLSKSNVYMVTPWHKKRKSIKDIKREEDKIFEDVFEDFFRKKNLGKKQNLAYLRSEKRHIFGEFYN